jgi:acid phosphatase (class A)
MKHRSLPPLFAFAALVATGPVALPAQENVMAPPGSTKAAAQPFFVRLDAFDFRALLPAPPAAGSLAARTDLETVLQVQAWRTPEQVDWAKRVARDSVFFNREVLGAWFSEERLPLAAAFFRRLGDDIRALDGAAKLPFQRLRPSAVDPRVQPCVELPTSSSYPSGSGMQAFVWAELLAEIFPAQRDALLARASRAAWGRVIGGVHFPSDVVAGRTLATAYLAIARTVPEFARQLEAVTAELRAAAPPR